MPLKRVFCYLAALCPQFLFHTIYTRHDKQLAFQI